MAVVLEETRAMLRTMIRGIDRKAEFSVSMQEGDQPGVNVTVGLRKHESSVFVAADQIEAAVQDAMRRAQVRTKIKRAIDKMMFVPVSIVATKLVRGAAIEGGFFRVQQGRGGGRR